MEEVWKTYEDQSTTAGKNAFSCLVILDSDTLRTLPKRTFSDYIRILSVIDRVIAYSLPAFGCR